MAAAKKENRPLHTPWPCLRSQILGLKPAGCGAGCGWFSEGDVRTAKIWTTKNEIVTIVDHITCQWHRLRALNSLFMLSIIIQTLLRICMGSTACPIISQYFTDVLRRSMHLLCPRWRCKFGMLLIPFLCYVYFNWIKLIYTHIDQYIRDEYWFWIGKCSPLKSIIPAYCGIHHARWVQTSSRRRGRDHTHQGLGRLAVYGKFLGWFVWGIYATQHWTIYIYAFPLRWLRQTSRWSPWTQAKCLYREVKSIGVCGEATHVWW